MQLERADAHIHLFEHGYQGLFTARPGVSIDEAECYQSLAADHGVTAALVVGFGLEPWCRENNRHIAAMADKYQWIQPAAFVHLDEPLRLDVLKRWKDERFLGVSFYIFTDAHLSSLAQVSDEVWSWLEERRWLISINSRGLAWRAWLGILQRHNGLRLLLSHLGLPPRMSQAPSVQEAQRSLSDVTSLASFPRVHVKLSGFYALTEPGYDYPHRAAWPYVQVLAQAFGAGRLLWGSDFSPCLDFLSFPQTLGLFQAMPFFTDADRELITGSNLQALLLEARTRE